MPTDGLNAAQLAMAHDVCELLGELRGALDFSLNPHRLALRHLGVDGMGWTGAAYSDDAFKLWSGVLRHNSDDLETLHHMAIMHHARAIDRETGDRPSESNDDWTAALAYWGRLWKNDLFWDGIAARACKGAKRDAVDALRKRFPDLLLRIHFDLAFDPLTQPHRRTYHLQLVESAQFPVECKQRVQREKYDAMLKDVPNAVWQPEVLDPEVLKQGHDVIERYLGVDPTCLPALEDALRLQVRQLRAHYTDLQAAGKDSPERSALLRKFFADAVRWRPYMDQLASSEESAAEGVRQKLCLWYRVMGDVHRALDKDGEAVEYYERGAAVNVDDDEQRRCRKKSGEARAYIARERASQSCDGARALCDQMRSQENLSAKALRFLANAYMLLDDFDVAEAICRQGLEQEIDAADLSDFDEIQLEQSLLQEMLQLVGTTRRRRAADKYIDKAGTQLESGRYQAAILLLDKAIEVASDAAPAWRLRCQCHVSLDHSEEARRDLEKFRELVTAENSSGGIAEAEQLEEDVRTKERSVADFGVEGLRFRRESAECSYREDFEQAALLLRRAVYCASPAGRAALHAELSVVLTRWATKEVNAAMKDRSSSLESDAAVCRRAIERLEEAVRLNPGNAQAQANLDASRNVYEDVSSAIRKRTEKLAQFGCEEAFQMDQEGIGAFNEGRQEEAIALLRRALERSRALPGGAGAPQVRKDLSVALTSRAIDVANSAQAKGGSGPTRLVGVLAALLEARGALTEAIELDPANTRAGDNLATIQTMLRTYGHG